jgi:hypothetical protein
MMIVSARVLCSRWEEGRGINSDQCAAGDYRMPESFSAFCSIVSLTAAKTSRIFEVSVACVRLKRSVMRN